MDEFIGQLFQDFDETFSITRYVINILICAILLFILSKVYTRYGQSISNRAQLGRVLIMVGLTTFIIISIVKSSLALSLGLVGALSIIRFRTAIKEPEELGFFFIAISLGFAMLILVIFALNYRRISSFSQNLLITVSVDRENKASLNAKINDVVVNGANQVELKRLSYSDNSLHLNYLINLSNMERLNEINSALFALDNSAEVTFIDSQL